MQTEFQTKVAKPLTFVLDFAGTLGGFNFKDNFNQGLFEFAIEMRERGNNVFFTTQDASASMNKMLTNTLRMKLLMGRKPPKLFDIIGNSEFVYGTGFFVQKNNLKAFLSERSITRADYVFDDDKKITYLPQSMVGQHIDPEIFIEGSPHTAMVEALRKAAAPAPQAS